MVNLFLILNIFISFVHINERIFKNLWFYIYDLIFIIKILWLFYIYNILNMNINLLLKINKNEYELGWIGMWVNVLIW